MATAADGSLDPDTEEGGPVKSFLEHLEDLRWMLVKCAAAVGVGILICLIAGNYVVAILLRPLEKAVTRYPGTNQVVTVFLGQNRLGTYPIDSAHEGLFNFDTNRTSPLFVPEDIIRLRSFAQKLAEPSKSDQLSRYLASQLSPNSRQLLADYAGNTNAFLHSLAYYFKAATNGPLSASLAADLNAVIQESALYDSNRFQGTELPPALLAQLTGNPQGASLVRVNQQLLLAAYPKDLSKNHARFYAVELVPMIGTNGAQFLTIQTDTNVDAAFEAEHMRTSISALGPGKAFIIGFRVALYAGIALASPFIFYFIGQFVLPALRLREKKYLWRGLYFAVPLFMSGVCFCYFILMPAALAASQLYSDWFGFSSNIWDAGDYIGFVCKFMLGMGLGFELPVVILVLVKIGLLSYSTLSKARPYMIVINLVLGAVLTTPEVFTQVLMAVPLQILYEISVWVAWYWERQDKKRLAAMEGNKAE